MASVHEPNPLDEREKGLDDKEEHLKKRLVDVAKLEQKAIDAAAIAKVAAAATEKKASRPCRPRKRQAGPPPDRVNRVVATKVYADQLEQLRQERKQSFPSFAERLLQLKIYKLSEGDLVVPQTYKDHENLGRYVDNLRQRKRGKGTSTPLTDQEVAVLDAIGFVWATGGSHCNATCL